MQGRAGAQSSIPTPAVWVPRSGQNPKQLEGTHIALVGVEDLLMATEKNVSDATRALKGVCPGGKRKGQPVIRACELHLGQVMDEKIELCGHTAQAGLNQPVDSEKGCHSPLPQYSLKGVLSFTQQLWEALCVYHNCTPV